MEQGVGCWNYRFSWWFCAVVCVAYGFEGEGAFLTFFEIQFFFLRCELRRHHEQHTAATMHHRCRHITLAILFLILFFVAWRALFSWSFVRCPSLTHCRQLHRRCGLHCAVVIFGPSFSFGITVSHRWVVLIEWAVGCHCFCLWFCVLCLWWIWMWGRGGFDHLFWNSCVSCIFLRYELRCHHEQHTAATMHHRCRHITLAILFLISFFVAWRALFSWSFVRGPSLTHPGHCRQLHRRCGLRCAVVIFGPSFSFENTATQR